jgi:hypothetical protein
MAKAAGKPLLPVPTATAPALDPTGERDGENRMEQSMYGVSVPTLRQYLIDMNAPPVPFEIKPLFMM